MKTPSDTDHASNGLGERVKPAPAPTAPPLKPTGTQGVFDRGGKLETHIPTRTPAPAPPPAPIVVEDSGDEE